MARYTKLLCDVLNEFCELKYNPMDLSEMGKIIDESWERIFSLRFPIWDEDYRELICKKILAHYYMQEIGAETSALFIFRLNKKIDEIMPYYNTLYRTIIDDIEDVAGIDLKEYYGERSRGGNVSETGRESTRGQTDNTERNEIRNDILEGSERQQGSKNANIKSAGNEERIERETGNVDVDDTGTQSERNTGTQRQNYNSQVENSLGHNELTTFNVKNQKSGRDTTNDSSDGLQKFQDTPMGKVDNLLAGKYLANATKTEGTYDSTVNYGAGEMKTGTESHEFSGADHEIKTGFDEREDNLNSTRTDDLHKREVRDITHSADTDSTKLEESAESDSRENSSRREENGRARSVDEYISNILENGKEKSEEAHQDRKKYLRHTIGRNTSDWIGQIMKWRDSLVNIDLMIIGDLESQFMQIW